MKKSFVAGAVLFAIAAFFSVSLLLVLLDFGGMGAASGSFFFGLGKFFADVYGACSVFIPIFLLFAASRCFIAKWSFRTGVLLTGSVVPFFTLVGIEKLCRFFARSESGDMAGAKLFITILIGLLVIALEFLLLSLFGDIIERKINEQHLEENAERPFDVGGEVVAPVYGTNDDVRVLEQDGAPPLGEENAEPSAQPDRSAPQQPRTAAYIGKLLHDSVHERNARTERVSFDRLADDVDRLDLSGKRNPYASIFDEAERKDADDEEPPVRAAAAEPEAAPMTEDSSEPVLSPVDGIVFDDDLDEEEVVEMDIVSGDELSALHSEETAAPADAAAISGGEAVLVQEETVFAQEEADGEEEESVALAPKAAPFTEADGAVFGGNVAAVSEEDEEERGATPEEDSPAPVDEYDRTPSGELSPDFFDIDMNADDDELLVELSRAEREDGFADTQDGQHDRPLPEVRVSFSHASVINGEGERFSIETDVDARAVPGTVAEPSRGEAEMPVRPGFQSDAAVHGGGPDDLDGGIDIDEAEREDEFVADEVSESEIPVVEERQAAFRGGAERRREPVRSWANYSVSPDLLETYPNNEYWIIDEDTKRSAEKLKSTLNEFKIEAEVTGIRKGPVVTMFELLPAPGVKLSKIVALQDNIALTLAASSVRIVAPIPGKHAVGIEVPNRVRSIVSFKEIIDKDFPAFSMMGVPVVLGKDISGEPQIIDLAKTPHLLIAGSTGAGKSVCVNSMLLSILYKRSPHQVRLILVDPKIVELTLYNDIPHLLAPVITEPKRALQALQYCLCEMERRYALLSGMSVRDIVSYNEKIEAERIATEKLPYIVVVIDEFADLMMTTGKELEASIARLAAKSRAVGIHLVLATQRPSIDVITGLIKANLPSRIAFMVASKMDSRIIIDQGGAEKLLGKGDMLYSGSTAPFPVRIQGTLVSDEEVESVVEYVKSFGEPDYIDDEMFIDDDDDGDEGTMFREDGQDPLYDQALEIVVQAGKASASYIQRKLSIGYNRAARLVEEMEQRGIVGPANGSKPREIIHLP